MTDLGKLIGEIPLGYYSVRREIESIQGFDTDIGWAVLHIVLSHHGTLEHGFPVVPATREAALVHAMDNLGGKLGSFDRIERALSRGPGLVGVRPRDRRQRLLPRPPGGLRAPYAAAGVLVRLTAPGGRCAFLRPWPSTLSGSPQE